jgi:tau tubulin kinase
LTLASQNLGEKDKQPLPVRKNVEFRGTARYVSINNEMEADLGRRDDIRSFFYLLVELYNSPLPWHLLVMKDTVT